MTRLDLTYCMVTTSTTTTDLPLFGNVTIQSDTTSRMTMTRSNQGVIMSFPHLQDSSGSRFRENRCWWCNHIWQTPYKFYLPPSTAGIDGCGRVGARTPRCWHIHVVLSNWVASPAAHNLLAWRKVRWRHPRVWWQERQGDEESAGFYSDDDVS